MIYKKDLAQLGLNSMREYWKLITENIENGNDAHAFHLYNLLSYSQKIFALLEIPDESRKSWKKILKKGR